VRKSLWMIGLALAIRLLYPRKRFPDLKSSAGFLWMDNGYVPMGACLAQAPELIRSRALGSKGWTGSVAFQCHPLVRPCRDNRCLYGMPTRTIARNADYHRHA